MSAALSGIRIIEVADESGVYSGKLLADLGAEVIKVEAPGGDPTRSIGPFYGERPGPNRSLFFWHYNTNKRSVELDLERAHDRDRLAQLLATADVLLTTGTPAGCASRGLDYATLATRHPHLIVAAISPFGQSGPRCEWKSCDTVAQALGGMVFVNGHPDEPPLRSFGLQAYHSASTYAAIGVMLALLARARTGYGQHVDVSLQECVAATVEHVSGFFQQTGEIQVRRGTLHWSRYFRVGRCRDGYVLHCSLGDWTSLVEWLKAEGKAQDLVSPEWDDFEYRKRRCEHLFDVLDAWAKGHTVAELVEGAQLRRIPYAALQPIEALADDAQLQARGFFVPVHHEELGRTLTYPGAPFVLGALHRPWRRAPLVGEHNEPSPAPSPSKTGAGRRPAVSSRPFSLSSDDRQVMGTPAGNAGEGHKGKSTVSNAGIQGAGIAPPNLDTRPTLPRGQAFRGYDGAEPATSPPAPTSSAKVPEAEGERRERVLDGVRVLDFTWVVAGPVATRILADHGAEVIKIERRDSLDFGSRRGGLTGNLNRGKRSLVINMADPRGVSLARDLARRADVVIDNFSSRVMANWELDYPRLRAVRPDIIAVSMSGFGHTGPQKDHVSYGPTLQALSGYTLQMRHPGREPAGWGFSYSDMAAGYNAALAVLVALWHRQETGMGQFIDASQFESVTALIGTPLLELLVNGRVTAALGNRSPERPAAPHGVYRCRDRCDDGPAGDRWCAICIFTEDEWHRFVDAIGRPPWTAAPRFRALADRLAHQDELDALVEAWTREHDPETIMHRLQQAGIAAGLVANARDLCVRDPQLQARRHWATVNTPEGETAAFDGVPARLSATPGFVAAPGPLLGEDSDEVLQSILGLEQSDLDRLRQDGVIT